MSKQALPDIPDLVYDHEDERYYLDGCPGATVMLIPDTDYDAWRITALEVHRDLRQHGHGTQLLETILRWADANHQRLTLFVDPIGDNGPNTNRLIRWYKKHGFERIRGKSRRLMRRRPPGTEPI
jgi:GNAT superfamily N-acetyltransferase